MTKEKFLERIKELETAKENMVNNLNVIVGMINEARYWLTKFEPADPNVEVSDGSKDAE